MVESKYDKLLEDILQKTRDGTITWTVTANDAFQDYVLHGATIFRSFTAPYTRLDDRFTLAFIERKVPHPEDERFDQHMPELLILKGDQIILSVTEYHVNASELRRLGALIAERNEDASSLLNSF